MDLTCGIFSTFLLIVIFSETGCTVKTNAKARQSNVMIRRWHKHIGFHRKLTTEIQMDVHNGAADEDCVFLVEEKLPSGMYADMDELKALVNWGGPRVLSENRIDIEKPKQTSPSHTLYIYAGGRVKNGVLKAEVTIPMHLRYHPPSDRMDQAKIILRRPRLLARCSGVELPSGVEVKAPCDFTNSSACTWTDLQYEIKEGALQAFTVPVGLKPHTTMVLWGTTSVAIIGALSILHTMIRYPPQHTGQ